MRSRFGIQAALYISLDLLAEFTVLIESVSSAIQLNNDGEQCQIPHLLLQNRLPTCRQTLGLRQTKQGRGPHSDEPAAFLPWWLLAYQRQHLIQVSVDQPQRYWQLTHYCSLT